MLRNASKWRGGSTNVLHTILCNINTSKRDIGRRVSNFLGITYERPLSRDPFTIMKYASYFELSVK